MAKIRNAFVLTTRRGAAMLADLEKARAASRARVYRSMKKRRTANLANLQKANPVRRSTAGSTRGVARIKTGMSFRFRAIELEGARSVEDWDLRFWILDFGLRPSRQPTRNLAGAVQRSADTTPATKIQNRKPA